MVRKRFDADLSETELRVLGDSAMFGDPYDSSIGAPRPTIRPEFVRWLASDPAAVRFIAPKGIRVWDVTLPDVLDLARCHISVPLDFRNSTIGGDINLESAETRDIYLWKCSVKGAVEAAGIDARGPLSLHESQFSEAVRLGGAQVKGDLDCSGANLTVEEGDALDANGAQILGNVLLCEGFTASGTIRLHGARIKGDLDCRGAKLNGSDEDSLVAYCAEIGGNVIFSNSQAGSLSTSFACNGRIWLLGARIGGLLTFWKAKVANVDCRNLHISTELIWMGVQVSIDTALDLTGVRLKYLREDRQSWPCPRNLRLDGFVYDEITCHERPNELDVKLTREVDLSVDDRIGWLMLQPEEQCTKAHPWMQLSKHLEGKGNHTGAKHVVYKYRCLLAKGSSRPAWRWLRFLRKRWRIGFAWLEQTPQRICLPIVLTLALGTLVFWEANRCGAMFPSVQIQPNAFQFDEKTKDEKTKKVTLKPLSPNYPPFQPLVYTLENTIPLLRLGMDEKWMPDRKHKGYDFLVWFRWVLIVLGWVQATILAASVADRFRK